MIANISQKFNLQTTTLLVSLCTILLEVFFFNIPVLSTPAVLLYILLIGKSIGERFFDTSGLQWWGGIALLLSSVSLIGVIIYYPYKLTPEFSVITIAAPLLYLLKKKKKTKIEEKPIETSLNTPTKLGMIIFLTLEIILVCTIISARSGELMRSPWIAFDAWFFILFALASSVLFFLMTQKTNTKFLIISAILHHFIFYSIAAIVYKIGFGFDGFIHRATESWILEHGFITPKEPFYIGQYGLVVTFSRITGIAIAYIDIFLIPALAALSIPTLIHHVFKNTWNTTTKNLGLVLSFVIPFIFFFSFNLTTPHNLTLLLLILGMISVVGYTRKKIPYILPALIGLTALGTHPLLGVPTIIIVLVAGIVEKTLKKNVKILTYTMMFVALSVLPLLMFMMQQWFNGHGLPTLVNPFSNSALFLDFFKRPFWYKADAVWYFEIIYAWQYMITPILLICAGIGFWLQKKTTIAWVSLISSVGLCIGAFLLRTLITFPNVASSEQGNYPLRLLIGSVATLLPLVLYGIYHTGKAKTYFIQTKLRIPTTIYYAAGSLIIGALLMLSLYFSYPQYNEKVFFPGLNVSEYDQKVVRWIHEQNETYDYVVLSTILTAVAALTEHPFASYIDTVYGPQFYYSIPSGGPLYLAYEEMVYQGQKRETIDRIFELTNVNTIYLVVPWYWARIDEIVEGAKKSADSWHSIDHKMWIFKYLKHDN